MGLVVYWYDFVCFGIVGVAFLGAFYVIWRREGTGKCNDTTMYESLVVTRPDMDGYYAASGVTPIGHVSSTQLWTSCWLGLHPIWLFGLRFASFLITSGFLAWDILEYGASIFVYYTEWTFTLVIVYFAIGTIVSAHGCMVYYSKKPPASESGQKEELLRRDVESNLAIGVKEIRGTIKLQSHYDLEAIQQRAGFWGYLMQTAYQTCAGAVILTDLVFWCIIVPFLSNAHLELNPLMGCMHTLNAVFLILDASVNSLPFSWFRLAYFVLWSCSYVVFQWVIHACGYSMWPYPFLELSSPWAPLWYLCLAVVHIPCYGLYSLLIRAKNSIFPRFFPQAFVKSF
ncbi:uncharacterized protein LOC130792012 [Actinidia eriantha]|uniref:uncharacterized protein LOC130792012 n=1 Tax=Actinidia eriantha TaxID=165200 RepID=UPI002585E649|nr:uncharacterized protein LOC130792012 [Actinidia eriantha]